MGKSVKVRTRLLSYFRAPRGREGGGDHRARARRGVGLRAERVRRAAGGVPAIKRWRPLYNVEHKRDSSLCFIKLTREAVPRLLVVGHVINDGAEYFGPLRGRQAATEAVRAVSDLLELRDCSSDTPMRLADQIELFRLGRIRAACAGRWGAAWPRVPAAARAPSTLARIDQARRLPQRGDGPAARAAARAHERRGPAPPVRVRRRAARPRRHGGAGAGRAAPARPVRGAALLRLHGARP